MSAERRKAMLAAMNGEENRPPQPQIPAGDIDAVAARAQSNIHAHGANLDIHSDADQHGGFTSARAMKRDGLVALQTLPLTVRSESPVKWDRSAVREALAAQDANKRPRVG
jgi:hypothetical protein